MFLATIIVSALLGAAIIGSGSATLAKVEPVVKNITGVGYPADKLWFLGVVKIAGGLGLIIGLWVAPLGIAAAIGVVLYFIGAVVFHLRAKEYTLAPPLLLLALAVAALVLRIATA